MAENAPETTQEKAHAYLWRAKLTFVFSLVVGAGAMGGFIASLSRSHHTIRVTCPGGDKPEDFHNADWQVRDGFLIIHHNGEGMDTSRAYPLARNCAMQAWDPSMDAPDPFIPDCMPPPPRDKRCPP
jgi:hypothetical protein